MNIYLLLEFSFESVYLICLVTWLCVYGLRAWWKILHSNGIVALFSDSMQIMKICSTLIVFDWVWLLLWHTSCDTGPRFSGLIWTTNSFTCLLWQARGIEYLFKIHGEYGEYVLCYTDMYVYCIFLAYSLKPFKLLLIVYK